MSGRKFVLLGCVIACVFAASTATAQMRGHSNSMARMGTRGGFTPHSIGRMPMQPPPMPGSMGRLPMHRVPMMNSAWGLRHFNRFNHVGFDRGHRFHRLIFIGHFGFPWWWGPWWDWNWGYYPYGRYEYSAYSSPPDYFGYGYEYGNYGYSYGSSGYNYAYGYPPLNYYGDNGTNYANDDESAVRNVLAEYTVAWNRHDAASFGRLFADNSDYVNIAGDHWKGVQEIAQQQAELFQSRQKTAVRTLTGVEVHFSTPDVALVDATWDVTGSSRLTGKAVPVLKEITTMEMDKTNGKWLITKSTESEDSTK